MVSNNTRVLSMTSTLLIFTIIISNMLVDVVSTKEVQLQDCPTLNGPAGSGTPSSPANISDDQYCIIDQCNIRIWMTGQQFEVTAVFTDYIIASNKDTQEFVALSRPSLEKMCFFNFSYGGHVIVKVLVFLFRLLLLLLIGVASGYILGLHVMFSVLRKLHGKLLIVYNTAVLVALFASMLLIASNLLFAPGLQAVCQVFVHAYSLSFMVYESLGTVVMAQIYYVMYRDYKEMADISPTWSSQLFEHYLMFAFAPMLPMTILTIGFDFTAKVGNETILSSGHCILPPGDIYESVFLTYMYIALHKMGQFLVFCYTFYYFCKLYYSFGSKRRSTGTMKSVNQFVSQSVSLSVSGNTQSSEGDDSFIFENTSTPPVDCQDSQEHHHQGKLRSHMSEVEVYAEKRKYLRRLLISASFPGATILSVIFWFLCLAVGPLLKPFSAGGGDIALLVQQATIAGVFLSSKKIFDLCKQRIEVFFTN